MASAAGCGGPTDPGERVWVKKCAACHGKDGRGKTRFSRNRPFADLTDGKWKQGGDRASIRRSIEEGVPKTQMEGFRAKLTPEQIDAATGYVLRLASLGPQRK
jgi:mono/diheme cytochrome c family protein